MILVYTLSLNLHKIGLVLEGSHLRFRECSIGREVGVIWGFNKIIRCGIYLILYDL